MWLFFLQNRWCSQFFIPNSNSMLFWCLQICLSDPAANIFSRYYNINDKDVGATRIDRMYHHGNIDIIDANYVSASFSDHHSLVVKVRLPDLFSRLLSPKTKPFFKARPEVVRDPLFKA